VLFGSQAWGQPTVDSDVDLLVIVSHSEEKPVQRAQRAYRRLRDLPVPLDVLVKTRAEVERYRHVYASLECEIMERGKVLYDRPS
jgi:predicted nucleotidyltransferase